MHREVAERCAADKVKRGAGRPRDDGKIPARGNGWAAASEPRSGRIVGMLPLEDPENYACWYKLLMKILWLYLNVNCIIHDRACKLMKLLEVQARIQFARCWEFRKATKGPS